MRTHLLPDEHDAGAILNPERGERRVRLLQRLSCGHVPIRSRSEGHGACVLRGL